MKRSIALKHIRRTAFIFLLLFLVTLLPSCTEDDGSGHIFKMNIVNNPRNLDPQLAEDKESLIIIENMLEGRKRSITSHDDTDSRAAASAGSWNSELRPRHGTVTTHCASALPVRNSRSMRSGPNQP